MTKIRYEIEEDYSEDCITIIDQEDELKTSFHSDIILYPMEDAVTVVNELNKKEAVLNMLKEELLKYEDEQDVEYWIKEILEDLD